jgi:hypothetical protein
MASRVHDLESPPRALQKREILMSLFSASVVGITHRLNRVFAVVLVVSALASSAAYAIPPGPPNRPATFIDWLKAQLDRLVG